MPFPLYFHFPVPGWVAGLKNFALHLKYVKYGKGGEKNSCY
jgi:hypothetical protein